jgi:carbamoyltransferase
MGWPFDIFHDASAVLLKDGVVVAGMAQERIDRAKHSSAFPAEAISFCLDHAGIGLSDICCIAYPDDETVMDGIIAARPSLSGAASAVGYFRTRSASRTQAAPSSAALANSVAASFS